MDKDLALEGKTQINLWLDIFVAAYKLNGQYNEMQWTTQRNAMDNPMDNTMEMQWTTQRNAMDNSMDSNGQRNG